MRYHIEDIDTHQILDPRDAVNAIAYLIPRLRDHGSPEAWDTWCEISWWAEWMLMQHPHSPTSLEDMRRHMEKMFNDCDYVVTLL